MKILYIAHEEYINGASRSLLDIISAIERYHEVYVLTSYDSGEFHEELKRHNVKIIVRPFYRWCIYSGSKVERVKQLIKWYVKEMWINHRTAKEMAKLVIEEKIEIIHTNTSVENVGGLISKYSGVKHFWHIREFADLDFEMYPLVPVKYYFSFMRRYTYKFLCVSKAVKNHYSQLPDGKKNVLYNGVSTINLIERETKRDSSKGETNFLISGRVSPAKGQQEAIQACEILLDRGVDNFHLHIAGTGIYTDDIDERLKMHVTFHGPVSDMVKLRENMDVELVCSRAEAFGRVTAEAMMGALPVIGSNTGGTVELIKDGKTGFLYEKGNLEELASKMKLLIEDCEFRNRLGKEAQKYATQYFTIEKCVKELIKLYQRGILDETGKI